MHPLIGLWVRSKNDYSEKYISGWVFNVPSSYTSNTNGGMSLFIGIICTDGKIREIEFSDLVIHMPNELCRRIGVAPNEQPPKPATSRST